MTVSREEDLALAAVLRSRGRANSEFDIRRAADRLEAIAGPPEPSEEGVARVDVQKAMRPVREYLLAMGTRQRFAEEAAERAADAAFALLSRSRRA